MLNKSYSYLVPLVNEECEIDSDFIILLSNTFAFHYDYPNDDMFVISYEYSETESFLQYIEKIKNSELYKESYMINGFIFITLYFPIQFRKELNLYKKGKFSVFSELAKRVILNYILDIHSINSADKVRRVLYKDEELRMELEYKLDLKIDHDLELSSKPSIVNETFILVENEEWR